jgi:hypothetical protein
MPIIMPAAPADASPHDHGLSTILQLNHLGQIRSERLARKATGFGQDLVEIIGFEGEFAEPRKDGLLLEQIVVHGNPCVAHDPNRRIVPVQLGISSGG